ncbi:MAG: family 43 glycosylhydrolase [Ruminococcus sp.]|nr:family 43 glycosylhydrolase [Ruminococcus sp.]
MNYKNPVIRGFYPDPSVCEANGRFYLVTSSFQYFPGVPLFESTDLVNWHQIGHVLTRMSQLPLKGALSSAGIFAPTIRYNEGTFYMVTTNTTTGKNFYVSAKDIYGEWSEPIEVEQDGIDPSLYFEEGRAYFMSNGSDDFGDHGITQCEIDIETGRKLSQSRTIWHGSGGRYLESPHLYKIGGWYLLTAAEGGTEYGHMITCARSRSLWEGFEGCPRNPILTNRDLGGYQIQGVGHGDLVRRPDTGQWAFLHLGFRQIDQWLPFHHLGRETFLTPVTFDEEGWPVCGEDGTCREEFQISGDFSQQEQKSFTFADRERWLYIREPDMDRYELRGETLRLTGSQDTLDGIGSPTFTGIRQTDFCGVLKCRVSAENGEAGISIYMDEDHRYDLAVVNENGQSRAQLRLVIGDARYVRDSVPLAGNSADLTVKMNSFVYDFSVAEEGASHSFGFAHTRYVSTEVACGFTGVILGLYAQAEGAKGEFSEFSVTYE